MPITVETADGRPRRGRPVASRTWITLAVATIGVLCLAGIALAGFHTTNSIYHGLGSTTGGGVGAGQPYAVASSNVNDWVGAGMYHQFDNGSWNQQCFAHAQFNASCIGDWGSAPCKKYAWTQATRPGGAVVMGWHWIRGTSCSGAWHQ